jgi:hypothetical protein
MYRRLGYFPTESSEHSSEYLPWFLRDDELIERFRLVVGDYVGRSEENLRLYEEQRQQLASGGGGFEIERSLEYASLIVHSIVTGEPRVIYGNVANEGLIENLPRGACVEVPCLVDGNGVQPTTVGALPPQLAALNRTFLNVCELTVRAALEGRRDHVLHAALLDPNASGTLSPERIAALVDAGPRSRRQVAAAQWCSTGASLPCTRWAAPCIRMNWPIAPAPNDAESTTVFGCACRSMRAPRASKRSASSGAPPARIAKTAARPGWAAASRASHATYARCIWAQ